MFHHMDGTFMGLGWLFWVIIIALIIWAVISVSRRYSDTGNRKSGDESALDILKKRYARGEISRKEYEEKKSRLT